MEKPKSSKMIVMASPEWERLIRLCAVLGHGRLQIIFKNGVPTDIDHVLPHLKLDDEQAFERDFQRYLTD